MMTHDRFSRFRFVAPWVAFLALLPAGLSAQAGDGGYLLGRPKVTLGVRAGVALPMAGGDLFEFLHDEHILGSRPFTSPAFGAELAVRLSERVDVAVDIGFSGRRVDTESRRWEGTDDLPIEQRIEFHRYPILVLGKVYLKERGRSVGSIAWIPTPFVPYLLAGGGIVPHRLVIEGEFVDEESEDLAIFRDRYASSTVGAGLAIGGGVEWSLRPGLNLVGEGRYLWGSGGLGQDFSGFDGIDLSELRFTVGLSFRR